MENQHQAGPSLSRGARLAIAAALVLAIVALAVSGVLLWRLTQTQAQAAAGLDSMIAQLEGVCGADAPPLTFPFSQTIRFQGDVPLPPGMVIPFRGNVTLPRGTKVPFKGNIPIKTSLRLEVFPGGPGVDVPIDTVIPVDTDIAFPDDITIPIDTRVPLPDDLSIPIDTQIPIRQDISLEVCDTESPVQQFLQQTIDQLRLLRGQF